MPRLSNERHERFARFYVQHWKAARAAVQAGMVSTYADELLQRSDVAARVQELNEAMITKADITAERVMLELGRVAFADLRSIYDDKGNLLLPSEMDDDAAATIAGLEHKVESVRRKKVPKLDADGEQMVDIVTGDLIFEDETVTTSIVKVKRYDKNPALGTLAKHFKIVGDEGDGLNAIASALADRLKSARKREGEAHEGQ